MEKQILLGKLTLLALESEELWDERYYNKYTHTKPSDIVNEQHRCLAVVCIMANHASWAASENKTIPYQITEAYISIYYDIRNFFYENQQVDQKDVFTFTRLID
jgi:hypothetical protein